MQKLIIAVLLLVLIGGGIYVYQMQNSPSSTPVVATSTQPTTTPEVVTAGPEEVIGKSVNGSDIVAYHFGTGDKEILFVGGIHGGYEWNTSLVAYELIDHLKANPAAIPANVKVTVIPVVNPDGLGKVIGTSTTRFTAAQVNKSQTIQTEGRFNARTVDLNRNFDCDWQATGKWQNKTVSGGTSAFSEPESQAIRGYIEKANPAAAVVWYSSAGGVYASACHEDVLPETTALTDVYAKASGYPAHKVFDYYEITGDMVNWLAKQKIPAISVLLTNHTDIEWDKNRAGVLAVLQHFAQ